MEIRTSQFLDVIKTWEINRLSREKTSVGNWATMLLTLYKLTRINFCDEMLMGQLTWLQKDRIVCFGNYTFVGDILYEWPQCNLKSLNLKGCYSVHMHLKKSFTHDNDIVKWIHIITIALAPSCPFKVPSLRKPLPNLLVRSISFYFHQFILFPSFLYLYLSQPFFVRPFFVHRGLKPFKGSVRFGGGSH